MFTAYTKHIHTVLFTITLPSILTLLFIYASFTQCDIFSQSLHNWLYNNVYSISLAYTYSTIYNYTTQYTNCAVTFTFPFTMWIFFHSYYIIVYSTMFTVRLHWILTVLFTITLPSILSVLFTYAEPFHNVIFFHNYCTIDSTTMSTAYPQHIHTVLFTITLPSTLALLFIYAFLFTMWYFSKITVQLTLQRCLQHIRNIYI